MSTEARIKNDESCHWYTCDGIAVHEVISKSTGNMRPTTIKDARKYGYLPSVTTIQRVLAKPSLTNYLIEQACLAVLTSPRRDGESEDEFVKRVLNDERQQEQHRIMAADFGTQIHADIESGVVNEYTGPIFGWLKSINAVPLFQEKVLVSRNGYAGTCDWFGTTREGHTVIDWKTTGKLPDRPWPEHEEQVAAYASILEKWPDITGYVCYIERDNPGQFIAHKVSDQRLVECYDIFMHYFDVWKHRNNYYPKYVPSSNATPSKAKS